MLDRCARKIFERKKAKELAEAQDQAEVTQEQQPAPKAPLATIAGAELPDGSTELTLIGTPPVENF